MTARVMRLLTNADIDAARNLKRIYFRKKKELNLSQKKLEEVVGMQQATISQYMNSVIALNTSAVLKFAKALRVHPEDIDPRLGRLIREVSDYESNRQLIPILHSASGAYKREGYTPNSGYGNHVVAAIIDTSEYAPAVKENSIAIINPHGIMKPHGMVAIRRKGSARITLAKLLDIDDSADVVTVYELKDRESESYQIPMGTIATMYNVAEIREPQGS